MSHDAAIAHSIYWMILNMGVKKKSYQFFFIDLKLIMFLIMYNHKIMDILAENVF